MRQLTECLHDFNYGGVNILKNNFAFHVFVVILDIVALREGVGV